MKSNQKDVLSWLVIIAILGLFFALMFLFADSVDGKAAYFPALEDVPLQNGYQWQEYNEHWITYANNDGADVVREYEWLSDNCIAYWQEMSTPTTVCGAFKIQTLHKKRQVPIIP